MSLDLGFTDDWGDGTYHFRLGVKQLDELQDITGIGAELLYWRFTTPVQTQRDWKTKWMRETIRLALIGGGTEAGKAEKLCKMYVDNEPKLPNLSFAIGAVGAALYGVRKATEGKTEAAETKGDTTATAPDASTSSHTTEPSPE